MKKIALIALLATTNLFAQELPIDPETKKVTFSEVVEVTGKSQAEIYSSVKSWGTSNFKSSKNTIDLDDKEAGKIVYKGNFTSKPLKAVIGAQPSGYINFTLTFVLKDSKYKVIATDFVHEKEPGSKNISCGELENEKCGSMMVLPNKKQWNDIKEDVAKTINDMFTTMKKNIGKNEKDF